MASKRNKLSVNQEPVDAIETPEVAPESPVQDEWATGTISDCEKLRIRDDADGEVLTVLDKGTTLKFKPTNFDAWYEVELEDGTAGYAMSAYIK